MLPSQWLLCIHCFTTLVSFTGFYTEYEPYRVRANMYVYLKEGWGGGRDEGGGGLITSSRTTVLRFTSHETNIYILTLLMIKRAGRKNVKNVTLAP